LSSDISDINIGTTTKIPPPTNPPKNRDMYRWRTVSPSQINSQLILKRKNRIC